MNKKPYTEYSSWVRRWAKQRDETIPQCVARLRKRFTDLAESKGCKPDEHGGMEISLEHEDVAQRYYTYIMAGLEMQAETGGCKRFFIQTPQMAEWLVSCVPDLDKEYQLAVADVLGEHRTAVFHLPTSMHKPSALISFAVRTFDESKPGQLARDWVEIENGKDVYVIGSFSRQLSDHDNTPAFGGRVSGLVDKHSSALVGWYIRLAYGVLLYAHCFPEAIKEGLPEDLAHPSHHAYASTTQTLEVHPQVCYGGTHASPQAHYRRGHFRTLRSERWGASRGKTVFVHETFVKGKAVTVLEPEEIT